MDENNNFEYNNNEEPQNEQQNYQQYEQPQQNEQQSYQNYQQYNQPQQEPKKKKGMPTWLKVLLIVFAIILAIGGTFLGLAKVTGLYDMCTSVIASVKESVNGEAPKEKKFEFSFGKNDKDDKGEINDKAEIAEPEEKETEAYKETPKTTDGKEIVEVGDHDVSGIVEMCMPSVVAITSTQEYETYSWYGWGKSQTYEAQASGSGIIIGEDDDEYMIATNNHVVEDAKSLVITFIDDTTANAVVKGRDASKDVAVVAVKKADLENGTADNIRIATIGDSDELKIGQGVVVIGNALGYGQSVTVGYVSALHKSITIEETDYEDLIQTDAAINPGNSGGAMLNMKGELIGINSAKLASSKIEGIGYAIPITAVYDILNDFSNQEARDVVESNEQGYLGIQGQTIDSQIAAQYDMPTGVYVYKIVEGVPAEDSELCEKDIITKLNSNTVENMEDLREILTYYKGGETIKLTVQRLEDGEYVEKTVEVELAYKRDVISAPVEEE